VPVESWQETKEQVRQATDIVELVGGYLQLRRQGRVFVGLCPWHDDTRPSLQINPERQSYKCFVCDLGGDVFSFLMQMEGVEFREALTMLAERAGVPLPTAGGGGRNGDEKQTLYKVVAWAEQEYHRCLLEAAEAEPARRYLRERGVTDESIARFRIGYAPDRWEWLLSRLDGNGFSPEMLARVGLAVARDNGGHYDRFRGRVLFSIRDVQSRPIATGGRILPELARDDAAKYINSPESPLFSKSNQLYALDLARQAISRQRNAIVVEGYTDCVAAHQAGIENVVAVLGTALGERHVALLRRYADTITLVLDGDEAGQRRTNEILELFVAQQVDLRILTLPQGADPCDFLETHGSEAFGRLLADAVDALQHKISTVTKGLDPAAGDHQANEALEDVLATVARAPRLAAGSTTQARLREQQLLARLARTFRVDERDLRARMTALRDRKRAPVPRESSGPGESGFYGGGPEGDYSRESNRDALPSQVHPWDRELVELILADPDSLEELADAIRPEEVRSPLCRAIYSRALAIRAAGDRPDFDRLMLEAEEVKTKSLLVECDRQCQAKAVENRQVHRRQVIDSFVKRRLDAAHASSVATLKSGSISEKEQHRLLDELMRNLRIRQG